MAPNSIIAVQAPPPAELPAGCGVEARITVVVDDGYHVQANPTNQQFLIPLRLEVKGPKGIRPGKPIYPQGQPYRLTGADDDLMTYGGTFEVVLPLQAEQSVPLGDHTLRAALHYQGCDEHSCLFPAVARFTLNARIVAPGDATPGEQETPVPDAVLNANGLPLTCANLTPLIKSTMRGMDSGRVLEVVADDPAAREGVPAWSRLTGNKLLATIEEDSQRTRFYLRKK